MDLETVVGHAAGMDKAIGVTKTISLESRDFYAETWEKDGTNFHISPMLNARSSLDKEFLSQWWVQHRFDNHRIAFAADEGEFHLECYDETEALSLVLNLQKEFNRSLP